MNATLRWIWAVTRPLCTTPGPGGYYPQGYSYDEANALMVSHPESFKKAIQDTLRAHVQAINTLHARGMYFFDYGNAFLLESSRAGADVMAENGLDFSYPSYVQDILGPLCFDYGFGPFRWVCASGNPDDLRRTDAIAARVLRELAAQAPEDIRLQMEDNLRWIEQAEENRLVVGIASAHSLRRFRRPHCHCAGLQRGHRPWRNSFGGIGP